MAYTQYKGKLWTVPETILAFLQQLKLVQMFTLNFMNIKARSDLQLSTELRSGLFLYLKSAKNKPKIDNSDDIKMNSLSK